MNRHRHSRFSPAAFTLLEVMLASVVLLMGVVGMIQVVASGSEMVDAARKQTVAAQIIHSEIDELRLSNWSSPSWNQQVNNLTFAATDITPAINAAFPAISHQGFHCTRSITDVSPDSSNTLLKVQFTVTWTGNTGHAYSRSSYAYVGKNGLYVTYQRS